MPAKRIYRNQREKVIGGVCAGIAEYFDIDVAWVRLAFVLSVFAHGFGIIAYIVAWIVFPRDERTPAQVEADQSRTETAAPDAGAAASRARRLGTGSRNAFGIILILLGGLFFLDQNFYWFRFDSLWPVILIGLGVYLLLRSTQPDTDAVPAEATPATAGAAPALPRDADDTASAGAGEADRA